MQPALLLFLVLFTLLLINKVNAGIQQKRETGGAESEQGSAHLGTLINQHVIAFSMTCWV